MPFPADGLRRISINNFGYGGTNAHAILDDALNYLRLNSLQGKHCSVTQTPESLVEGHRIQGQLPRDEGTEGISPNLQVNGNGTVYQLGFKRPIVLPFSTADESGIGRILETYQRYFKNLKSDYLRPEEQQRYLQNLSYTLSTRRSALPWKSFVVVDSIEQLQAEELANLATKPQRSSSEPLVSFVFTGQGAQWFAMGRELSLYPVYRESLERSETFIRGFGCEWSLIGTFASLMHCSMFYLLESQMNYKETSPSLASTNPNSPNHFVPQYKSLW
jgi:acyl transferase domain-containing protein